MILFHAPHSDGKYVRGPRGLPPWLESDVDDASQTDAPVLITGDADTAAWIARLIYLRMAHCDGPFRVLDAADTETSFGDRLNRILRDAARSGARGVLFLRELAAAGPAVQAELNCWLGRPPGTGGAAPRLIASTTLPLEDLTEAGGFDRALYRRIARCQIRTHGAGDGTAG
ncbi:MAG: hypothetical protein HYU53_13285 [Acidobacteria bacterium]|nr:hypothetical protein [Acidobacteriota bacterium]